jgi:hypothetical protein
MPLTSIIIATRNRPELIKRAVESAHASAASVEVVVVDDASDRETETVCAGLAGIKYLRLQRKQGVGSARNAGLIASRGEYITFLDDDDLRLEHSIDRQIEMLEREPAAGMVYAQANVVTAASEKKDCYPRECLEGDLFWQLLGRNFIPCGSAVFRRSCLSRIGLPEDDSPGIEDWDLWVRIAELYPISVLPEPVVTWRQSTPISGQLTSEPAQIVCTSVRQFRRWMKLPRAAAATREQKQPAWREFSENMAEHLIWECARALRHGKLLQPIKNVSIIPRLDPLTLTRIARHRVLKINRADLQTL